MPRTPARFLQRATLTFCVVGSAVSFGGSMERGVAALELARTGDSAAVEEAIEAFGNAVAENPEDALARARMGAALVWRAVHVPLIQKKAQVTAGLKELDAAVAIAPSDPKVRLVRARNGYLLPKLLGRHEIVTEDFEWLVATVKSDGAALDPGLVREILFHAGAFALKERRSEEAARLLEHALQASGSEPSDQQLQSMLALALGQITPLGHGNAEAQESPAASGP